MEVGACQAMNRGPPGGVHCFQCERPASLRCRVVSLHDPVDGGGHASRTDIPSSPPPQPVPGVAFALFKTRSAARSALLMDGKPLAGRAVRITRVSSGAGAAGTQAWQGVKATRKRGAGPAAAHLEQRGVGVKKGKSPSAKRGPGQKRPAVAARKALQRAQRKRGGA